MRPAKPDTPNGELFRRSLEAILDPQHELLRLAALIDWDRFDDAFGPLYHPGKGRRGLATRLMAGLHLLKHMKGLSDEETCATWLENPYCQAFCGEMHFQHRLPFDRSSMTRWRKRIGPGDLEVLLTETIGVAVKTKAVSRRQLERITVDTTVQTKAVAHPTDSHLLLRAIEWLNRAAKRHGIKLRQFFIDLAFIRLATRARREASRRMHTRGHKQGQRWVRKMRTWLGRLRGLTRGHWPHGPARSATSSVRSQDTQIWKQHLKSPSNAPRKSMLNSPATKTSSMRSMRRRSNVLARACPGLVPGPAPGLFRGQSAHALRVWCEDLNRHHERAM